MRKQFCLSDTNFNHYIAQLTETLPKLGKKCTVTF